MKKGHHIELISNIESLGLVEEAFDDPYDMWVSKGENPLGEEVIFKCKTETLNEVFSYELATMLDMPTPKFKGVWFEDAPNHPDGEVRPANSIGLLVEKVVPSSEKKLFEVVLQNKRVAAQHLFLRLFLHGGEYPQILSSDFGLLFFDLEFIGPQMRVGDALGELDGNLLEYVRESDSQWKWVKNIAHEYNILDEFKMVLKDAGAIITSAEFAEFALGGASSIRRHVTGVC